MSDWSEGWRSCCPNQRAKDERRSLASGESIRSGSIRTAPVRRAPTRALAVLYSPRWALLEKFRRLWFGKAQAAAAHSPPLPPLCSTIALHCAPLCCTALHRAALSACTQRTLQRPRKLEAETLHRSVRDGDSAAATTRASAAAHRLTDKPWTRWTTSRGPTKATVRATVAGTRGAGCTVPLPQSSSRESRHCATQPTTSAHTHKHTLIPRRSKQQQHDPLRLLATQDATAQQQQQRRRRTRRTTRTTTA